jgi:hypothetical protein
MQNFAQFFWLDPVFVWQVSLYTEMFYVFGCGAGKRTQ